MASYKDIYVALSILVFSASSSWLSLGALEQVEHPLATFETPLAAGTHSYELWYGSTCIGTARSQLEPHSLTLHMNALLSDDHTPSEFFARIILHINEWGQLGSTESKIRIGAEELEVRTKGVESIQLAFEAGSRESKKLHLFNLPGPITVGYSKQSLLEVHHPYISRTLRFFSELLNHHMQQRLQFVENPSSVAEKTSCKLPEVSPLEVSSLSKKISVFTKAWEQLTTRSQSHDRDA